MIRHIKIVLSAVILISIGNVSGCSGGQSGSVMSPEANQQTIRKVYDAFGSGDMETILGSMSDDVTWLHPGNPEQIPFAGIFRGKEGVKQFFATVFEQIDVLEQNIFSIEAGGDKVFVVGYEHMRVKNTGKEYRSNWIHMYTLDNGRVTMFEEFIDTAALVSAFSAAE